MLNEPLRADRIRELITALGDELDGDWVLVGGALAAVWFAAERATEDVDLVPVDDAPERRYALMDFALAHGLPLEAVNSAADFFLRRVHGFSQELELLHAGARGRILRPSPTLFLLLKVGRMSEADLGDCLDLLAFARQTGLHVDGARVLAHIAALPSPETHSAAARRAALAAALASSA